MFNIKHTSTTIKNGSDVSCRGSDDAIKFVLNKICPLVPWAKAGKNKKQNYISGSNLGNI